MERILTCIICPRGCEIRVGFDGEGKIISIDGASCKRGPVYAETECTHPTRTVTSTVRVEGGGLMAVKTSSAVPKELVFECMKRINAIIAPKNARIGDVVLADICNTGADVIVTGGVTK